MLYDPSLKVLNFNKFRKAKREREVNVNRSFPSISKIHYVHNLLNSIPFMLARRYVFPTCTAKPLYSLAMKEGDEWRLGGRERGCKWE